MSRFRKTPPRTVPGLNTTALPDLIFTLLFFFMLVTNMRAVPELAMYKLPEASELQKLREKSLLVYIIIGKNEGLDAQIPLQVNNSLVDPANLLTELQSFREKTPPQDRDKILVILRIDKNTKMETVSQVREYLRKAGLLTVHYAAEKSQNKL